MQVGTALWRLASGSGCPTEEGIKNITKPAEIKALKASSENAVSPSVSEAVISGTLIRVREDFVGFINLLELLRGTVFVVTVGMILEGQLTKSLSYLLVGSISTYAEDFIVIPFYWHIGFYLTPLIPLSKIWIYIPIMRGR